MNNIPRRDKAFHFKAEVKDAEQGTLHAVVSCFGLKDSYGDIVVKGAFSRFITDCKASGGKFPPGVWSHDWERPIAKTLDMWEGEDGLHILGQFNLETEDGRDAYSNVKNGLFTEYSFGFSIADQDRRKDANYLTDIYPVYEWSPVLVGANRATHTIEVKDAAPPPVHFKADYLGTYAEANACIAALQSLASDLFWGPIFNCIFACGEMEAVPAEERLTTLESAFAEYGDLCVRAARALMQMAADAEAAEGNDAPDADEGLYMGAFRSFLESHYPIDVLPGDLPAGSLVSQADAARAVVVALKERMGALNTLRVKEGRVLSEANRNRVAGVRDDLSACIGQLDTFLTDTAPSEKADVPNVTATSRRATVRAAKAALLRTLMREKITLPA